VKKINPALWSRIYLWWQWLLYWSGEVTAVGSLGKALRKHSLHEKTAASVLLKPFISSKPKVISKE